MKKLIALVLILSFGFSTTLTVCSSGCDHTTITAALAVSSDNDLIQVNDSGNYLENIIIPNNRTVDCQGATINGTGSLDYIINITANYSTLQNCNVFHDSNYGVYVSGNLDTLFTNTFWTNLTVPYSNIINSDSINVSNNTFVNDSIRLSNTNNSIIYGNTFVNWTGTPGYGGDAMVDLLSGENNEITYNSFDTATTGNCMTYHQTVVDQNLISNNEFESCNWAIFVSGRYLNFYNNNVNNSGLFLHSNSNYVNFSNNNLYNMLEVRIASGNLNLSYNNLVGNHSNGISFGMEPWTTEPVLVEYNNLSAPQIWASDIYNSMFRNNYFSADFSGYSFILQGDGTNHTFSNNELEFKFYGSSVTITNMTSEKVNETTNIAVRVSGLTQMIDDVITLGGVSNPRVDPLGYENISVQNITNTTEVTSPIIKMYYNRSDLGSIGESSLMMMKDNGTHWENVSGQVIDYTNQVVYAIVDSFSVYGLFGETDSTPPVVMGPTILEGSETVTISFITDEPCNYSLTYNPTIDNNTFATSHDIYLTGLDPLTGYSYTLDYCDNVGNCDQETGIFTTLSSSGNPWGTEGAGIIVSSPGLGFNSIIFIFIISLAFYTLIVFKNS